MDDCRYFLRRLESKDAGRMLEWMQNADVVQFLRLRDNSADIEEVLKFIESSFDESRNIHFAIVDLNDNYMGTVSLKSIENSEAEYAIALHPSAMGTGAARQATVKILFYAFYKLKLDRVYLHVLEENTRAVKFYDKMADIGMTRFQKKEQEFLTQTKISLWYEIHTDNFFAHNCRIHKKSYGNDAEAQVPLVSVLVPLYNNFQFVQEALDSIFSQTYSNIEIIIGDDCSNSVDFCELFVWIDKNAPSSVCKVAAYSYPENVGTVANMEYILNKSKGEYVLHMAADDVLHDDNVVKDFYDKAIMEKGEPEFIVGQTEMWDSLLSRKLSDFLRQADIDTILSGSTSRLLARCITTAVLPAANFYRRSLFDKVGVFFDKYSLVEDWPMQIRTLLNGIKVFYIDRPVIKHRAGGISNTRHRYHEFHRDLINIYLNEVEPHKNHFDREVFANAKKEQFERERRLRRYLKPKPTLSIIMPCYNVEDTIERALESIFMQEVDFPYEIIIVNDASTDESPLIFDRFREKHICAFPNMCTHIDCLCY